MKPHCADFVKHKQIAIHNVRLRLFEEIQDTAKYKFWEIKGDKRSNTLHTTHPNFTYTKISVVKKPDGNYYLFVEGTKPDRLGYYVRTSNIIQKNRQVAKIPYMPFIDSQLIAKY